MKFNWLIFIFIILSLIGLLDSFYLALAHYSGQSVNCSILNGCDRVLKSDYALIFNIPLALLGVIYYGFLFCAATFIWFTDKKFKTLFYLPFLGFVFSLWLVYLQIFIIRVLCFYCLISALTSILLFIISLKVLLITDF